MCRNRQLLDDRRASAMRWALLLVAAQVAPATPLALSSGPAPSGGNIAVRMQRFNRQGRPRQALSLFAGWANASSATPEAPAAWVEAISAHGRLGAGESALACFQRMQALGIATSLVSYTAVIRACATRKLWPVALSLLDDLRADGLEPDTIVCNAALVACERGGQLEEAELLLREMESKGPAPDVISRNTLISTASRLGKWRTAIGMLEDMERLADTNEQQVESAARAPIVRPDVYTYTATISACERGGEPSTSLEVFTRMQARGVAPNTASYNAAIRAAATRELWPVALSLLSDMRADAVPLDLVTYNSVLAACERGGELGEAELVLADLLADEDSKIAPDAITFHTALACARRAGGQEPTRAARFAVRIVRVMMRPPFELTPSVIGFTGAMAACNSATAWRAAAALLGRMERAGVQPDLVALREALLTCAGGGYWRKALDILNRLEELAPQTPVPAPTAGANGLRGAGQRTRGRGRRGAGRGGQGGRRGRGGPAAGTNAAAFAVSAEPLELGARACQLGGQPELAAKLEAAARARRTAQQPARPGVRKQAL